MNIANKLMMFFEGKIKLWKSFWLIGEIIYPILLFIIIFYIEMQLYNNDQILLALPLNNINMPIIDFYKLHIVCQHIYLGYAVFKCIF